MIINGNIFYLMNLLEELDLALSILSIVIIVASIILWCCTCDGWRDDDEIKKFRNIAKIGFIVAVVFIIITIIIPDKETMYQMLACKYITTDNINLTLNELKELVDYLATKISEVSK